MAGDRVDRAVATLTGVSRERIESLIRAGAMRVDGRVPAKAMRLSGGEVVEVAGPWPQGDPEPGRATERPTDEALEPRIVLADEEVIVVDKPAGLVVHPGAGNSSGTLVEALVLRFPDLATVGEPGRPGVVHRLDKGTSGLMVVARTEPALRTLVGQIRTREVERRYKALVGGAVSEDRGVVEAPVGRSSRDRTSMAVSRAGRWARTSFEVEERHGRPFDCTLLECRLDTGRTHQVRVHLAAIGHPVLGDDRYGTAGALGLRRPFLHAYLLGFRHPRTGERIEETSPLPPDLELALAALG
jgi:23S rRNA pseudouridine1911/1915/1917 synthase